MSDTPRTDAEERSWDREYERSREAGWPSIGFVVDAGFARELERENARLRAELEKAKPFSIPCVICGKPVPPERFGPASAKIGIALCSQECSQQFTIETGCV